MRRLLTTVLFVLTAAGLLVANFQTTDAARADVNDFVVESFDAVYELAKDEEGRSTLKTTEVITIIFPEFDQNRGVIRDVPHVFDDHSTDLNVKSVTDEHGKPRNYKTEEYGEFLSIIIAVPEGSFVHGKQTYVLEYTQRDVTKFYKDTGVEEFYWDVNGTDWAQPFGRISAKITLSDEVFATFNGDAVCYRGVFGSDEQCEVAGET
ncbi:MAG TPA: DUF2207 domain-containing protein, partial [Microbacteriaceae bacterium]|nr:DUF2207 domain-containing protein [Microbacteriaceae bacterium]